MQPTKFTFSATSEDIILHVKQYFLQVRGVKPLPCEPECISTALNHMRILILRGKYRVINKSSRAVHHSGISSCCHHFPNSLSVHFPNSLSVLSPCLTCWSPIAPRGSCKQWVRARTLDCII